MYVFMEYVCVCVYIYIYIHTHTHTCTHIYITHDYIIIEIVDKTSFLRIFKIFMIR